MKPQKYNKNSWNMNANPPDFYRRKDNFDKFTDKSDAITRPNRRRRRKLRQYAKALTQSEIVHEVLSKRSNNQLHNSIPKADNYSDFNNSLSSNNFGNTNNYEEHNSTQYNQNKSFNNAGGQRTTNNYNEFEMRNQNRSFNAAAHFNKNQTFGAGRHQRATNNIEASNNFGGHNQTQRKQHQYFKNIGHQETAYNNEFTEHDEEKPDISAVHDDTQYNQDEHFNNAEHQRAGSTSGHSNWRYWKVTENNEGSYTNRNNFGNGSFREEQCNVPQLSAEFSPQNMSSETIQQNHEQSTQSISTRRTTSYFEEDVQLTYSKGSKKNVKKPAETVQQISNSELSSKVNQKNMSNAAAQQNCKRKTQSTSKLSTTSYLEEDSQSTCSMESKEDVEEATGTMDLTLDSDFLLTISSCTAGTQTDPGPPVKKRRTKQQMQNSCALCDQQGHTEMQCQMICKNCNGAYHNMRTCKQTNKTQKTLATFLDYCVKQFIRQETEVTEKT